MAQKCYIKFGPEWIALGEKLMALRKKKGLKTIDVQNAIGIQKSTLSSYEAYGNIGSENLSYLCSFYHANLRRPDEDVKYFQTIAGAKKCYDAMVREKRRPIMDIVMNKEVPFIRIRYRKDEEEKEE